MLSLGWPKRIDLIDFGEAAPVGLAAVYESNVAVPIRFSMFPFGHDFITDREKLRRSRPAGYFVPARMPASDALRQPCIRKPSFWRSVNVSGNMARLWCGRGDAESGRSSGIFRCRRFRRRWNVAARPGRGRLAVAGFELGCAFSRGDENELLICQHGLCALWTATLKMSR